MAFGFNLGKKGNGLGLLLPALLGGAIGVFLFKMQSDKQMAEMETKVKSAAQQELMRGGLSNSLWLSYNTVPYFLHNLPTTTEWNPENLQFSGSISDAGNGYTFAMPKSAM